MMEDAERARMSAKGGKGQSLRGGKRNAEVCNNTTKKL